MNFTEQNSVIENKNILIVDNNPASSVVVAKLLQNNTYNSTIVNSGEEALDMLGFVKQGLGENYISRIVLEGSDSKDYLKEIDLVITAYRLPEMDGVTLANHIKSLVMYQFIPVIILTDIDDPELIVESLKGGADDYITKPVDEMEFIARVRSNLRLKVLFDEQQRLHQHMEQMAKELGSIQVLPELIRDISIHLSVIKEVVSDPNAKPNAILNEVESIQDILNEKVHTPL